MTWLLGIRSVLSNVPWFVWAALAIIAAWGIDRTAYGAERYSEGRESVLSELRAREAQAKDKALEAILKGDKRAIERAKKFEAQEAVLRDAIEAAETDSGNSLDALF